jgi:hypothetical protein
VTDEAATQRSDAFLTHTQDGAKRRARRFAWTAPAAAAVVVLRVSGLAANGDFTPLGDAVATGVFTTSRTR